MPERKGSVTYGEKENCRITGTFLTDYKGKTRNIKRRPKSKSEGSEGSMVWG
jgi:hypothetical protein